MTDIATTPAPARDLSPLDAAFAEYRESVRSELVAELRDQVTASAVAEIDVWLKQLPVEAKLLDRDSVIDRVLDVRLRLTTLPVG